jgi:hypothetical protein
MVKEELQNRQETLRLIQKDLQFTQANEAVVEDEDDEQNLFICVIISITMCYNFNLYVL